MILIMSGLSNDPNVHIAENVKKIERLFVDIQLICEEINDPKKVVIQLDSLPAEFRSIAYESASFYFGYESLLRLKDLSIWNEFKRSTEQEHLFHIDIGLGWAMAKMGLSNINDHQYGHDQVFRSMVYDGMGYYYALYKARYTIILMKTPEDINGHDLQAFDQGIGRRLWYLYHNDLNKLSYLISCFDDQRKASIYRGLGIAYMYVSGFNTEITNELEKISGENWSHFKKGAAIGTLSRASREYQKPETRDFCESVFQMKLSDFHDMLWDKLTKFTRADPEKYWYNSLHF